MKYIKIFLATMALAGLAACGGGGGSPGGSLNTGSTTNGTVPNSTTTAVVSTTGNSQTSTLAAITVDILNGAGVSSTSISALEIGQISANVKDASGKPVVGAIVKFSESVSTLLTIAPISATALTDSAGNAVVEFRAASPTSAGATQVNAAVVVSGSVINANKAISISSAPKVVGTSPQLLANALNFLDVVPADKSIVLAGSGGNGRSESASLRFRVVDKNNSPVKGVAITFSIGSAPVALNIPTSTSDNDGVVVTTISSGSIPTAVVVSATVDTRGINSQSDQLLVTTGLATQAGFDISAGKYNLNGSLTGDTTNITARLVDSFGNPVADGIPVVFTTNYGSVGSSSKGGCSTLNGTCSVDYKVQDPRPVDGQPVTVIASTRIGNGTVLSGSLLLRVTSMSSLGFYTTVTSGVKVSEILTTSCKPTLTRYVGTGSSFPAAGGTSVVLKVLSPSDVTASITDGALILDQLFTTPRRTPLSFSVDLTNTALLPACVVGGPNTSLAEILFTYTNQNIASESNVFIRYPTN